MAGWQGFTGVNLAYVLELYDRFRKKPSSVDPDTRALFERSAPADGRAGNPARHPERSLSKAVAAVNLAQSIRRYGHLAAQTRPARHASARRSVAAGRNPRRHRCRSARAAADLCSSPLAGDVSTCWRWWSAFRRVYCSTTGYDYAHVFVPEERRWLRQAVEQRPLPRARRSDQPAGAARSADPGRGVRTVPASHVPGQDALLDRGARHARADPRRGDRRRRGSGHRSILIGMAHRGRLNVMAHVLNKPYAQILAEFKDPLSSQELPRGHGVDGRREIPRRARTARSGTAARWTMVVSMPPNPSHLEAVDPVVEGMARAAGTATERRGAPRVRSGAHRCRS